MCGRCMPLTLAAGEPGRNLAEKRQQAGGKYASGLLSDSGDGGN
jgi:hypothetical protein